MLGIYIWALLIIFITIATAGWEVILVPIIGCALWALLSIILDSWREKWSEKRSPRKGVKPKLRCIDFSEKC